MIGYIRIAHTPEQDRVVLFQCTQSVRRHVRAFGLIARGAVIQVREVQLEGIQGRREGLEDGDGRGDNFDADAVAGDAGDIVQRFSGCGNGYRGGSFNFFGLAYVVIYGNCRGAGSKSRRMGSNKEVVNIPQHASYVMLVRSPLGEAAGEMKRHVCDAMSA